MSSSSFSNFQFDFSNAEYLPLKGSTCDCYRVKLYGKLHFLKQLKEYLRNDPRYLAALQKEFETGYKLEHPNLVRYISRGNNYLLTDYVDGETLSDFISSHPSYFKNKKNSDRFVSQLLNVVAYLHSHQIVHLDLKPDNIMITRIGYDVKLIDLGYCYTDSYTDTMGRTDKYAAPEQMNGSGMVDARTDIFAIGKVLQRLPCAYRYHKLISRSIQPNPAHRFQSVSDMQKSLPHTPQWLKPAAIGFGTASILALILFLFPYTRQQDTTALSSSSDSLALKQDVNSTTQETEVKNESPTATAQNEDKQPQAAVQPVTNNQTAVAAPTVPPYTPTPQTAPAPTRHVEISTLRTEIRNAFIPILNSTMGHLRGKPYSYETWYKADYDFTVKAANMSHDLWNNKYCKTDIPESTYNREVAKVRVELQDNLYNELLAIGKVDAEE